MISPCLVLLDQDGEYKVIGRGTEYFTNDRDDALATADAITGRLPVYHPIIILTVESHDDILAFEIEGEMQ